jgi:hypothetical protein
MKILKTDWSKVFNSKEVATYLSLTDVIKLSTCNSKLKDMSDSG